MATRIFDLHCDTLDRLSWPILPDDLNGGSPTYAKDDEGQATPGQLQSMRSGRSHITLEGTSDFKWAQCMAVFIPDTLTVEQSARFFEAVSATLPIHERDNADLLSVAHSAADVEKVLASGRTCAIPTIENGKLLAAGDHMFDLIAEKGVRMVTLTWNAANPLGSGHDTQQGLTDFGRKAIRELEARRIVVDVSHLNDPGFADVASWARRPFVASHSNSRAVRDVPRNLTDDQFKFIRDAGGIVGLNFCDWFVSDTPDPTPTELLAHIEHWLDLGGAKTVALGSDYDGCDTPSWLAPCSTGMATLEGLLRDHFGDTIADAILFDNAHDFFVRNETQDDAHDQEAQRLDSLI